MAPAIDELRQTPCHDRAIVHHQHAQSLRHVTSSWTSAPQGIGRCSLAAIIASASSDYTVIGSIILRARPTIRQGRSQGRQFAVESRAIVVDNGRKELSHP